MFSMIGWFWFWRQGDLELWKMFLKQDERQFSSRERKFNWTTISSTLHLLEENAHNIGHRLEIFIKHCHLVDSWGIYNVLSFYLGCVCVRMYVCIYLLEDQKGSTPPSEQLQRWAAVELGLGGFRQSTPPPLLTMVWRSFCIPGVNRLKVKPSPVYSLVVWLTQNWTRFWLQVNFSNPARVCVCAHHSFAHSRFSVFVCVLNHQASVHLTWAQLCCHSDTAD